MYQKGLLLDNFKKLLGSHREHKNDVAFHCPVCQHHKKKLNINLENQKWHCWVCNAKGRKFIHLLKKINAPNDIIKEILKNIGEYKHYNKGKVENTNCEILLPKCFKPLWKKHNDVIYKHAIKYLNKRNIEIKDIKKNSL